YARRKSYWKRLRNAEMSAKPDNGGSAHAHGSSQESARSVAQETQPRSQADERPDLSDLPDLPERPNDYLLSVVLPIFNEEQCAAECVRRLQETMKKLGCRYELIFVNDGSSDRTLEILRGEKARDRSIRILNFSRNFGHQISITAGIDHARGDALVILDSDLQDPPEFIVTLVQKWKEGYDVVHAQRISRKGDPLLKKILAAGYYRFLNQVSEIDMVIDVGDFRLISRRAAEAIKCLGERHRYIRGMMCWIGYRQIIVQYEREPRLAGESKFSLVKQARFAIEGIFSFSTFPMRLATWCGVIFLVVAIAMAIARLLGIHLPGHSATVMILLLVIGGLQLICLGALGQYIGYIYAETKRRPLYFLTEIE
ncbi:MAG TPA: glycosyltransferase, partial [Chroococcales cyanobacterium]